MLNLLDFFNFKNARKVMDLLIAYFATRKITASEFNEKANGLVKFDFWDKTLYFPKTRQTFYIFIDIKSIYLAKKNGKSRRKIIFKNRLEADLAK